MVVCATTLLRELIYGLKIRLIQYVSRVPFHKTDEGDT